MASFMVKIKGATHALPHIAKERNLVGLAVDKGIRLGGSFGLGLGKGYYRERWQIAGRPADAVIGGGAFLAAGLLAVFGSHKTEKIAQTLNAVGDTALSAYLHSLGASMGTKKAGRKVYISAPGVTPGALPPGLSQTDVLGAQDGLGAYLSAEDIMRHSAQR